MSKQLHIRLEDNVFDELSDYANENGQSVQNCVSGVLIRMLSQQKSQKKVDLLTCLLVLAECELHSITLVVTACIPANGTNTANRLTWLILANSQKAILLR